MKFMMMCSFHGSTDVSFFVAILMRMQLQEIFNEADTNKDGKVNTDELAALIANSEVRYSFAHWPPNTAISSSLLLQRFWIYDLTFPETGQSNI
jgi:hypothetical protein